MSTHENSEWLDSSLPALPAQLWQASGDRLRGIYVSGLYPAQVRECLGDLRRAHDQQGATLLVLDAAAGAGAPRALREVFETYVEAVAQRAELSEAIHALCEQLFGGGASTDLASLAGFEARHSAMARLWTLLSRALPASLIVLEAGRFEDSAKAYLRSFLSRIFADPLGQLAAGIAPAKRSAGSVVFVGEQQVEAFGLTALGFQRVDATAEAPGPVREFLEQPGVLGRLLRSTGGSLTRLRALVEGLPDSPAQMLSAKFDDLQPLEQRALRLLAIAGEPLTVELVRHALGQSAAHAAVQHLIELGYISRRVEGTRLLLFIDEPDFRSRLLARVADDEASRLHSVLAQAAEALGEGEVFELIHRLAGGDVEEAAPRAVELAREKLDGADWDDARRLLEAASEATRGPVRVDARRAFVRLERATQHPREALAHCDALLEMLGEDVGVELERAEILLDSGEHGAAREAFSRLVERAAHLEDQLRARRGLAESQYLGGEPEAARDQARALLDAVESCDGSADEEALARAEIEACHLLGKLAIFDEEYPRARGLFARVRELAAPLNWTSVMCRAETNLGIVAMQLGELDEADRLLAGAARDSRGLADVQRGGVLLNLAMLRQRRQDFAASFDAYVEAVETAAHRANAAVYYTAAYNMATLYQDVGAFGRAIDALGHLEGEPCGPLPLRVRAWAALARAGIYFEQDRYKAALEAYEAARAAHEDAGSLSLHGPKERLQAALSLVATGRLAEARAALEWCGERGDARSRGLAHLVRAELSRARDASLAEARRALRTLEQAKYHHGYCRAALLAARLLEDGGQDEEARELLEEANRRVQRRADAVPDALREDYFAQPVHQRLLVAQRRLQDDTSEVAGSAMPSSRVLAIAHQILEGQTSLREEQKRLEHECIRVALERTSGNITQAAELLQLNRSRLSQIINADDELAALKQRLKQ